MNIVILVAGLIGLAVAVYAVVDIARSTRGRRRLLDIVLVIAAAAATIAALLTWGDRLLQ
jgi:hypothetical protein